MKQIFVIDIVQNAYGEDDIDKIDIVRIYVGKYNRHGINNKDIFYFGLVLSFYGFALQLNQIHSLGFSPDILGMYYNIEGHRFHLRFESKINTQSFAIQLNTSTIQ